VRICVYCASIETIAPHYPALAADVGREIAARGWELVSGGGQRSMMGAVAGAARAGGARTTGVIPRSMVEREWADHDSDELLVTETMRERKALMEAHADAFLALPGGLGTCEELFDWVHGLGERGFVTPDALARLVVTTDVGAALDACGAAVPVSPSGL